MPLVLPVTMAAPIPEDRFRLSVKVHLGGTCSGTVPKALVDAQNNGIETSLVTLLTQSTIFYKNRTIRRRSNETDDEARIRKQWQDIEDFHPRVEQGPDGVERLVVDTPKDGEESKPLSKLLGEAVTLHVAQEISGINHKFWTPRTYQKGVRHDLEATGKSGIVLAEARGRFNGNNLNLALGGIEKKFTAYFQGQAAPTRTQAIGVVYCVRDSPDNTQVPFTHDVFVADPGEDGDVPSATARWRALAVHYTLVFRRQGMHRAADAIARLVLLDDRDLEATVRRRVEIGAPVVPGRAQMSIWGRTTVSLPDDAYVGTFFRDLSGFRRDDRSGVFFGLQVEVINRLARCALDEIEEMSAAHWVGKLDGYEYVRPDDGTLYVRSGKDGRSVFEHP